MHRYLPFSEFRSNFLIGIFLSRIQYKDEITYQNCYNNFYIISILHYLHSFILVAFLRSNDRIYNLCIHTIYLQYVVYLHCKSIGVTKTASLDNALRRVSALCIIDRKIQFYTIDVSLINFVHNMTFK